MRVRVIRSFTKQFLGLAKLRIVIHANDHHSSIIILDNYYYYYCYVVLLWLLQVFDVSWPASVLMNSTVFVPFTDFEFVTKRVRIVPQENGDNDYQMKMRFELNGCPWPHQASVLSCMY